MDANEYLDQIEKRAEAATEGPWEVDAADNRQIMSSSDGNWIASSRVDEYKSPTRKANSTFIAHARQDVPALVGALRAVLNLADRLDWEGQPENHGGADIDHGRVTTADRIRAAITEALADQK